MGTTSSSEANSGAKSTSGNPNTWTIILFIEADDALANFAVESLKQLDRSFNTPSGGKNQVVVPAHFAFPNDAAEATSSNAISTMAISAKSQPANADAPGKQTVRKFIFRTGKGGTLAAHLDPSPTPPEANIPDDPNLSGKAKVSRKAEVSGKANGSEALKEFLTSVYNNDKLKADHYALFLWGHGPELLLQPGVGTRSDSRQMYITPIQLRDALKYWTEVLKGPKLDIVGFDACFMSMFEMAYELKEVAKYMVASQEDVPDQSFPYGTLIKLFRKHDKVTDAFLKECVEEYIRTYQEYIFGDNTGFNPVTLSALSLDNCGALKEAVRSLACALRNARGVKDLAGLLIAARESSQDYAGGLYVDLSDFCTKLSGQLGNLDGHDVLKAGIQKACDGVQKALRISSGNSMIRFNGSVINSKDEEGQKTSIMQVNGSVISPEDEKEPKIDPGGIRSHGISIYLPYFTVDQEAKVNPPLVKGGHLLNGTKGYSEMLNGAAAEYLMCARRNLILDTESYYRELQLAKDTHWYDFITQQWTRALIEMVPADLDYHYSAQQSWMNAIPAPVDTATLCPPEPSPSQEPQMVPTQ